MTKQQAKQRLKALHKGQRFFLMGLLSGILLSIFFLMLLVAVNKNIFCKGLACQIAVPEKISDVCPIEFDENGVLEDCLGPTIDDVPLEITDMESWKDEQLVSASRSYTIQKGDSLWAIAEQELGDGYRWVEIYELNQNVIGDNPDLIYAEVHLGLPAS